MCKIENGTFEPCRGLAGVFSKADTISTEGIPEVMKELSPVCPYCGFRFLAWPESNPWGFIPEDCKELRIYPDGSWRTVGHPVTCRGTWKNCPDRLKPGEGKEFATYRRP